MKLLVCYCTCLLAYISLHFCIDVPIKIILNEKTAVVDNSFLSLTIDAGNFKTEFKRIDFHSKRLYHLAQGLTGNENRPEFYLRIGGTAADHIIFDPTETYVFNSTIFDEIYEFVSLLQWKLVFGLNALERNKDGSWDPSNAIELIDYITKKGYYVQYELGNELELCPTHLNITIEPEQLAKDFLTLRTILNEKTRNQAMLVGPDTTTLHRYNYFARFLSHVNDGVLDAITFHHYYSASENITVRNFTSVKYLDSFLDYCLTALKIIDVSIKDFPPPPVWIGETSSTYDGGNKELGESYAAGFLWLDKLGLSAQLNISVVMRQSLKGGLYSLINKDYDPNPDYWSSLLYKQLVGRTVLNVTGFLKFGREVRVYAHCVNMFGGRGYNKSSIVLIVLNLNPTDLAEIRLQDELESLDVHQYLFTPDNGDLSDRNVQLNGHLLTVLNDNVIPDLKPLRVKQPIIVPPLRYGYFVVLGSYAPACDEKN